MRPALVLAHDRERLLCDGHAPARWRRGARPVSTMSLLACVSSAPSASAIATSAPASTGASLTPSPTASTRAPAARKLGQPRQFVRRQRARAPCADTSDARQCLQPWRGIAAGDEHCHASLLQCFDRSAGFGLAAVRQDEMPRSGPSSSASSTASSYSRETACRRLRNRCGPAAMSRPAILALTPSPGARCTCLLSALHNDRDARRRWPARPDDGSGARAIAAMRNAS